MSRPPTIRWASARLAIFAWVLAALVALAATAVDDAQTGDEPPAPRTVGLVERAETRLAQLDVTVIGPAEVIGDLGAADFTIRVHLRKLTEFKLDRICGPLDERPPATLGDEVTAPVPLSPAPPAVSPAVSPAAGAAAVYLFYFDQPHLTLSGRQRALDLARLMVDRLVTDGRRAMIVSNAASLKLIQPMTADPEALKTALKELENDRKQWDSYAEQEVFRIDEVVQLLNRDEDVQRAATLARLHQKEETWRTEQNLRRLEMALGQLSEMDPPKAVIYFADTMRSNPGEHYMSFFGAALRNSDPAVGAMSADGAMARAIFDRVLTSAAAQGVRFYTVEAQGLISQFDLSQLNPRAYDKTDTVSSNSRVRAADAQRALGDLASETGGRAFLHGVSGARIANRILEDFSCLYLISFDPSRYREDVPYRVSVEIERKGVQVRTRGMIVFPSESTRLTSRLVHAFGSAGTINDAFSVRTELVPIDFGENAYRALLQVSVPPTPLQGASWDLGATIIARNRVRGEASGRIQVSGPGIPVVLEREIDLKPGAQRIVTVAHESGTGLVASNELAIDWPSPADERAVLTPIALLQPERGAFLRNDKTRRIGSLAHGEADPTRVERPTALIGLVCRSRRQKGQLRVERRLTGRSAQDFPPLTLDLEENRCAQVRDLLPAGSLIPGYYRYEMRVLEDDTLLQERSREFYAVEKVSSSAPLPPRNPAQHNPADGG